MNAEEIKINRKKLNLTQKRLAEMLGVSVQTVNGYENGKEIPSTKIKLLENILYSDNSNILNEESEIYKIEGYDKKILNINTKIKEYNNIIELSKNDPSSVEHYKEIIKLLNIQIDLIIKAKENHNSEL